MQRGVKVQVLLDQQEYDRPTSTRANALHDEALAAAGASVKYKVYSGEWSYERALQMHAKYMIIDDAEVLTGSLNWSINSELQSFENLVAVAEPSVVRAYVDRFAMKSRYGTGTLRKIKRMLRETDDPSSVSFSPIALTGEQFEGLLQLR